MSQPASTHNAFSRALAALTSWLSCGTTSDTTHTAPQPLLQLPRDLHGLVWASLDDCSAIQCLTSCRRLHSLYHLYSVKAVLTEDQLISLACLSPIHSPSSLNHTCSILLNDSCCTRYQLPLHKPRPRVRRLRALRDVRLLPLLSHLTQLDFEQSTKAVVPLATLPTSLTSLSLPTHFNQPLALGHLAALVSLSLGYHWNDELQPGTLPPSLTCLTLSAQYNHPLVPDALPSSLLRLDVGMRYSHPLNGGVLPASLTWLRLGAHYNHPLPAGVLPPSLTALVFGWSSCFNQPLLLGSLPHSLTELRFGVWYSQSLAGVLPASLTTLVLGRNYDLSLHSVLARDTPQLTTLRFDDESKFNQPLTAGDLPPHLHTLNFGRRGCFNHALPVGLLPASLVSLRLPDDFDRPCTTDTFAACCRLRRLTFGLLFSHRLTDGVLPASLRYLTLGRGYRHRFTEGELPAGLRELSLWYQTKLASILPPSAIAAALNESEWRPAAFVGEHSSETAQQLCGASPNATDSDVRERWCAADEERWALLPATKVLVSWRES